MLPYFGHGFASFFVLTGVSEGPCPLYSTTGKLGGTILHPHLGALNLIS